jgi:hypothetical protein
MWPWEHLAFGYLLYSALARASGRRPRNADALVLAVTTQLPDLIDKPLAWWLGILPSGLSLGHSLLFAVPVCLLAFAVGRRTGDAALGVACSVGYLSHLAGDAVYPALTGGRVRVSFLWWPLGDQPTVSPPGLFSQFAVFLGQYWAFLGTPRGRLYAVAELTLLLLAVAAWVVDGYPGVTTPDRLPHPWRRNRGPEDR